jgi:hypothetical protein
MVLVSENCVDFIVGLGAGIAVNVVCFTLFFCWNPNDRGDQRTVSKRLPARRKKTAPSQQRPATAAATEVSKLGGGPAARRVRYAVVDGVPSRVDAPADGGSPASRGYGQFRVINGIPYKDGLPYEIIDGVPTRIYTH